MAVFPSPGHPGDGGRREAVTVMREQRTKCTGTLTLRNNRHSPIVVRLEPWADESPLEAGAAVDIAFSGPPSGRLEIELSEGEVVVYGWEGATMSVAEGDPEHR